MKISLTCPCGAAATFEDCRGAYIVDGGKPDGSGRVYKIEVIADKWKQEHAGHVSTPNALELTPVYLRNRLLDIAAATAPGYTQDCYEKAAAWLTNLVMSRQI